MHLSGVQAGQQREVADHHQPLDVVRVGMLQQLGAGLVIALLGFASTVALSKFLMRGQVIE
ncbi:MAG: monovalent cation/H+ antiporter complex subunit F [Rhodanobacter sp.]|jgi:hypothetical protein|uniref:monovalent cation/H+ antiporter complex subunit F n=1 Tax=Rhodanobacter sp. KK11 TaxID=3083255 RepID=UPI0029669D9C|nr:monovalent cation/H+ antiporter complex subunit F [Rhodanobacter sp. KK11]MDW2979904.1 monovalent cation/H+ antiporter complex subunit F [Rhodanobacter sp. KK11]